MRLIDADALLRDFLKDRDDFDVCVVYDIDIREAPTIDAVPVEQVKAQVIDIVKSFEVLVGCTGVGVITKAIERMETPSPYITL
jgi:predicted dinucleotide-utilizing enzyme